MQSRWPGEGMFKGFTDYFAEGSKAVEAVGSYLRKIPVFGNDKEAKERADAELKEINNELMDTRVRLGRNKEARRTLEEHYNALVQRMVQMKADADADALALQQAVKAEQDLDKEIAEVKSKI